MKSLFESRNKLFSHHLSLQSHQRNKYCAKSDKTEEYWAQNEEDIDQLPDDSYDLRQPMTRI